LFFVPTSLILGLREAFEKEKDIIIRGKMLDIIEKIAKE